MDVAKSLCVYQSHNPRVSHCHLCLSKARSHHRQLIISLPNSPGIPSSYFCCINLYNKQLTDQPQVSYSCLPALYKLSNSLKP